MIAVRHLSRRFGAIVAVDDVSFSVGRGEVLGFLGPNGAGKSTTMKMVAGFLAPSAGSAAVCGFDVQQQPIEAKSQLGYLPEGAPAYPDMTPRGFLSFVAAVRDPIHNAVLLRLDPGAVAAARPKLAALAGVKTVELVENGAGLLVRPIDGRILVAEISALARTEPWRVSEVHVEHGRLETVF